MAQLLAGGVYHRFHRFDRVHMEGLRTILAGTKFAQSIELIEFCEIMTFELQPSCGVMRKPLSEGRVRRDLFAPLTDLCLRLLNRRSFLLKSLLAGSVRSGASGVKWKRNRVSRNEVWTQKRSSYRLPLNRTAAEGGPLRAAHLDSKKFPHLLHD